MNDLYVVNVVLSSRTLAYHFNDASTAQQFFKAVKTHPVVKNVTIDSIALVYDSLDEALYSMERWIDKPLSDYSKGMKRLEAE